MLLTSGYSIVTSQALINLDDFKTNIDKVYKFENGAMKLYNSKLTYNFNLNQLQAGDSFLINVKNGFEMPNVGVGGVSGGLISNYFPMNYESYYLTNLLREIDFSTLDGDYEITTNDENIIDTINNLTLPSLNHTHLVFNGITYTSVELVAYYNSYDDSVSFNIRTLEDGSASKNNLPICTFSDTSGLFKFSSDGTGGDIIIERTGQKTFSISFEADVGEG